MKKKLSAALLSFMLVFQVMSSGYLAPFTALANEAPTTQLNDEETPKAEEKTAEEIAAAEEALAKATEAVNSLFADADHKNIVEGLDEYRITTVQSIVNKLEDGDDKTKLDELVTKASLQVTANKEKETVKADKEVPATTEKEKEKEKEVTTAPKEDVKTEDVKKEEEPAKAPKKVKASEAGTTDLGNIITEIELFNVLGKVDKGTEYELPADLTKPVYVEYKFTIPKGSYSAEKKYVTTFKLPEQFKKENARGTIKTENEQDKINYSVENGIVTFTAELDAETVTNLQNKSLEGIFFGVFNYSEEVRSSESVEEVLEFIFGEGLPKSITLPIKFDKATNKVEKFGVKMEGGKEISSTMTPDAIKWTIDINNEGKEYGAASVTEKLPAGLTIQEDSLKAKSIIVGRSGNYVKDDTQGEPLNPTVDKKEGDVTISLGKITKPTRITFITKVDDTIKEGSKTFTNTATFDGVPGVAPVINTNYGEPLKKEFVTNDNATNKATWKIIFNENHRNFTGEQTVKDTMVNMKNIVITKVSKISKDDKETDGKSEVSFTDPNFTFPKGDAKWVVEYTTDYDRIVNNSLEVKNTATFGGVSKEVKETFSQGIVTKSVTPDFANKKLTWTVTVNDSGGTLPKDTIITDIFSPELTLSDTELEKIKIGEDKAEKGKNNEFTITLSKDVEGKQTFEYVTTFNPNNLPSNNKFKNDVTVKRTGIDVSAIKEQPIKAQTQNNGTKSGVYDPETHDITWTANINYNLNDISGAEFTDTWSGTQYFKAGSLKVYKLKLAEGQDDAKPSPESKDYALKHVLITQEASVANKGFKFKFQDLNEDEKKFAYQITYKTKVIPENESGNELNHLLDSNYKNVITFESGGKKHKITSDDVVIPNANEYFSKTGEQVGENANWTVDVNKSGSYLIGSNVITDTLGEGHRLNADTIKMYSAYDVGHTNILKPENLKVEGNTITISLGNIAVPYVLTYNSTILADDGVDISNVAKFENYDATLVSTVKEEKVKVDWARFGGSASLKGNGPLKIQKVGPTGERGLEGAEFEIYSSDKTTLIDTVKTDENGLAQTELKYKYKKYFIKEVKAPVGYKISSELAAGKEYTFNEKGIAVTNQVDVAACTQFEIDTTKLTKTVKKVSIKQGNEVIPSTFVNKVIGITNLTNLDKTKPYIIELTTTDGKKITVQSSALKYESTTSGTVVDCKAFITDDIATGEVDACTTTTIHVTGGTTENPITKGKVVVYDKDSKEITSQIINSGEVKFNTYYHEKDYDIKVEIPGYKTISVDLDGDCQATVDVKATDACAEITATIKDDAKGIEGAKVQILDKDGKAQELDTANHSIELKTNTQGKVIIPVKYATGDYKIKVTKTGFKTVEIPFTPHNCEFVIDLNNTANACENIEITFTGTDLKENKVYVVDKQGNKQDLDEKGTKSLKLDKENKVTIPTKYANGEYTIVLVQDGKANFVTKIESDDCKQTITVTEESTNGNTCPATTITVKNGNEVIEGAKVVITKTVAGEEATVLFTGTTDDNGKVTTTEYVNLSDKEIKVEVYAKGYKTDTAIKISDENCEAVVDLNKNACPDYAINVVDQDGKVITNEDFLKGSEFNIIGDTEVIEGVKINAKGELVNKDDKVLSKAELTASKTAKYTLVQTKTAPGFKKLDDQQVQDLNDCTGLVTINLNKTTDPTNPGASCPDFSVIYKGPENSTAEFKIVKVEKTTDAEGKDVVTETPIEENITVKTDEDTKTSSLVLTTKSFEPGEYKLVQTKSHSGFYNAATKEFTVEMGTCVEEIEVTNSPIPPTPAPSCTEDTVVKVTDTDGKKVSTDNAKVIVDGKETPVTTADGTVIIPKDLLDSAKESTIIITLEDGRTTTVVLPKDRVECTADAKVPVLKVCEENPTITVKDKNGKDVPTDKIVKVTVNGKEVTPTIEKGKVVIPKDSVNPKVDSVVTVTTKGGEEGTVTIPKFSENCDYTIVINNTCDALTVNVTENGKKAENGTVSIIDQNGKVVATQKITENGKVTFPAKYVDSSYSVKVTIGKTTQTVPVNANENCEVTVNVKTIACEKATIHVTLDGKPVSGATVITLDKKGNEMDVDATDKNGNVSIDPIYTNKDHKFEVTVEEETKVVKFTGCDISIGFKTKPVVDGETEEPIEPGKPTTPTKPTTPPTKPTTPPTNVDGDKEENTGNNTVKPNNKYDIYDEDGNLVEHNATIDKNGQLEAGKLPEGTYTFVNDKGEKVTIKVGKDGKLPQTGSDNTMLFGLAGVALLGAGLFLIGRNRKRNA